MKMCNGFCSIVPHGQPVAVLTQLRYHVILGLVDDAVCGEVILVEGPVQAHRGDVARADEGADAGALLRHREARQRPL